MRTAADSLLLPFIFLSLSCCASQAEGDQNRIRVDSEDVVPGCSRYLNCVNPWVGMGMCAYALHTSTTWKMKQMSFYLATVYRDDWVAVLSGCQNSRCLARAKGGCDEALECMNRGRALRGCTPPRGYFGGRYCRDNQTLSVCNDLDGDGINTEISVKCDEIGMECVEMDRGEDRLAACGFTDPHPPPGLGYDLQVTCAGTLARLQRYGAILYWDCALNRAACEPGVYADWEQHDFCRREGPACEVGAMGSHCDGDLLVDWCNGNEVGYDCSSSGQVCRDIRILLVDVPLCTYDTVCNPFGTEETCQDGNLTYCAPEGSTTVSCGKYGFRDCAPTNYSWFKTCTH